MKKENSYYLIVSLAFILFFFTGCKKDPSLPVLSTHAVTEITSSSAKSGGNITDDGGGNIISRGVVWGESENPTIEDNYGMTGDGSGTGEFASVITGLTEGTLYYMRAYAINSAGMAYGNQAEFRTLNAFCGIVTFIYGGEEVVFGTVEGQNGTCWLDRNLGASRVATAYNDDEAYGDLFQWGRMNDGHQYRTTGTTSTLSNSDNPGHSNFIISPESPWDWRVPKNDNLWQGNGGINVCPVGWRVPTEEELENELLSWSSEDYSGAFESPLKITAAGYRGYYEGVFYLVGMRGHYWTTTVSGSNARYLRITSENAQMAESFRASGASVRCIKDN